VDAGFASFRQPGFDLAQAILLAGQYRLPRENWTYLAGASVTYASQELSSAQAVTALSIPLGEHDHFHTEIGLSAARFSLANANRGGNGSMFARQHVVFEHWGAWTGGVRARSFGAGEELASFAFDAGLWRRIGPLYLHVSGARTTTEDWRLLTGTVDIDIDDTRDHLFDAQAGFVVRGGPHEFGVSATSRRGLEGTVEEALAVSSQGVLQLTERLALIVSGGRQLVDPVRGLPETDYFTLAGRFFFGSRPLPVMQRSSIAHAEVIPVIGGGGELNVRVFATDTMIVDIAGDFSDWQPIPLVREGAFFVARVELPPGKYRVAIRVNYGVWRAPRNLARVRDDYGGESGLVVIP
jgi:hypothetical protein